MNTPERIETQIKDQITYHRSQAAVCNQHVEMIAEQQREAVALMQKLPSMAEGLEQAYPHIDARLKELHEGGAGEPLLREILQVKGIIQRLAASARAQSQQAAGTAKTCETLAGSMKQQAIEHESHARGLEKQGEAVTELASRSETAAPKPAPKNGASKKKAKTKAKAKKKATKKARSRAK